MTGWMTVVLAVCVLAAVVGFAAVITWMERRLLGIWQDRLGPNRLGPLGILQVLSDMLKLMTKHDWIPVFADRTLFILAPCILVASLLLSFAVISFGPGMQIFTGNIGILFLLGMSSLAVYGVMLGGYSSRNKYSLIGGLRAAAQMVSYEVFMGLSLMGVVMLSRSFNLADIVEAQRGAWFCFTQPLGMLIFVIAGIAESHRLPFDLPEAEQELTAGFHSEYGGMKFTLLMLGEYLGVILISSLIVTLFFGGWLGPDFLPAPLIFFLKTLVFVLFFILLRCSLARPRYDQLMEMGWKVMLPLTLVNLLVTGAVALWLQDPSVVGA